MPRGPAAAETIGARIAVLRERRGWSGRFLASRAGISASTLSRIERGERSANNRYLIQDLAAALECSVTDLTGQPYAPADRELVRSIAAVRCVGYQRAGTVTNRAIDAIQPHLAEPGALSLLGTLHLTATHAAMGQHRPEQAFAHQAEAEAIAERTGETRSWRLPFGPANVNVWRMGLEIDAGRHGKAVEVAASTATLGELPACRQSEFYLELARGLAGDRDGHDRAVRALLTAERLTPQKVRSSPSARETAHDLRESARRASVGSALRGLCERVGLPD